MNTKPLQSAVGGNANRWKISVVLHVVLLQLGKDVFAVRVLAQDCDVRTDLVDEQFALRRVGDVNHALHHVVSKLVLHHCVQRRLRPTTSDAHNVSYSNYGVQRFATEGTEMSQSLPVHMRKSNTDFEQFK